MKYITLYLTLLGLSTYTVSYSQNDITKRIEEVEAFQNRINHQLDSSRLVLEGLKLNYISSKIDALGHPKGKENLPIIKHSAMHLAYDEKHEQPRWVMHMVIPDIIQGNVSRTNDFREDSLVKTGTAVTADYWYSGYDRGHMAPSADFRWSPIALSQSYLYSNISPQKPEFNREKWAELENVVRDYVIANKREIYVVTGSLLHDSLPKMQNTGKVNEVSIPKLIYKIILDLTPGQEYAIGFMIPNGNCSYPVISYAVSIDDIEKQTGLDFFATLPDALETQLEMNTNATNMKTRGAENDVEPILPTSLPKGKINTVQAKYNEGTVSCVCGTVVSTKYSEKSGSTFLNLDKKFPNAIFSVSIWEKDRTNFSYQPEEELYLKKVCITGTVELKNGIPTMSIKNEKAIEILDLEIND